MNNASRHTLAPGARREQARLAGQLAALAGERWDLGGRAQRRLLPC